MTDLSNGYLAKAFEGFAAFIVFSTIIIVFA